MSFGLAEPAGVRALSIQPGRLFEPRGSIRTVTAEETIHVRELEARIRSLEATLAHVRAVADSERRRADVAESSAKRAWSIAAWGGARPREGQPV